VPDEENVEKPDRPEWNPSGLELARAVVATFGSLQKGKPRRARPRPSTSIGGRRRYDDEPMTSGPTPDDRDPQALDATMDRLVAEHGWTTNVAVAGAIARWDHIVGPEVAAHCRAERYADAELTVRADSTAWATQVRLLAPTLVLRLNQELGDDTVRRVTVLGPTGPSWNKGPRRVRDGRGPRDTYG
jgi:predicted nucleic acid-binding Zn ribbon protein